MGYSFWKVRRGNRQVEEDMMLWVAVVLIVAALVSFLGGFVLFANGAGVAPQRRTPDDPTGVRRAASRVAWPDVFRGMPRCVANFLKENASRSERLEAAGSFLVLVAVIIACLALLALLAALI
jgi:uncharacterized membrane protein